MSVQQVGSGPQEFARHLTDAINSGDGKAFYDALCAEDKERTREHEGKEEFIADTSESAKTQQYLLGVGQERVRYSVYDGTFRITPKAGSGGDTVQTGPVQFVRADSTLYKDGWCLRESTGQDGNGGSRGNPAVDASVKADLRTMALLQETRIVDEGAPLALHVQSRQGTKVGNEPFMTSDPNTEIDVSVDGTGYCIEGRNSRARQVLYVYSSEHGLEPTRTSC